MKRGEALNKMLVLVTTKVDGKSLQLINPSSETMFKGN
jgi:hypothetical protein